MNLDLKNFQSKMRLKSRQIGKSYINSCNQIHYLYEWESAIVSFKRKEKLRKIFKKDF